MELHHYRAILAGSSAALFILEICIFVALPKRLLAKLIEKRFNINRTDHQKLIVNFYDVKIDLMSSLRFRLSIICQLALIIWIFVVSFVYGCIMQVQNLSNKEFCPLSTHDCFIMGKLSRHEKIACEPGHLLSNSTHLNAICYVWVFDEQNTLSVINQIGICSSVFSLVCHVLKFSCHISRRWWGLLVLILLVVLTLTALILSLIIEFQISMTGKLLLIASASLLINVIQLSQFTRAYKRNRVLPPMKF